MASYKQLTAQLEKLLWKSRRLAKEGRASYRRHQAEDCRVRPDGRGTRLRENSYGGEQRRCGRQVSQPENRRDVERAWPFAGLACGQESRSLSDRNVARIA